MHFPPLLFSNGMQVEDINLNVGTKSDLSESIIKDVKGVSIVIWRSLRDLMHQVPSIEAAVKVMDCVFIGTDTSSKNLCFVAIFMKKNVEVYFSLTCFFR